LGSFKLVAFDEAFNAAFDALHLDKAIVCDNFVDADIAKVYIIKDNAINDENTNK